MKRKPKALRVVLPWHRGQETLSKGYIVTPLPQSYCYRVARPQETPVENPDGLTLAYHVCIWPTCLSCDCPDFARNGDRRPCKHLLATYVQVWHWAQLMCPITDLSSLMDELGITSLHEAFLAYESRAHAYEPTANAHESRAQDHPAMEDCSCGAERTTECQCASAPREMELRPGTAVLTAGGRTAYVRPAADYGRSFWANESAVAA